MVKKRDYSQRRYTYDFNPVQSNKWIRLRTNGSKTLLTIKEVNDRMSIGVLLNCKLKN